VGRVSRLEASIAVAMGRLVYRRMAQCLAPHRIRLRYPQNIVKLLQSEPSPHHCYHCTYNASDICHLCTQSANCFFYRDRLPTSTTNHQPPTTNRATTAPKTRLYRALSKNILLSYWSALHTTVKTTANGCLSDHSALFRTKETASTIPTFS
jgi:hypothetical protein